MLESKLMHRICVWIEDECSFEGTNVGVNVDEINYVFELKMMFIQWNIYWNQCDETKYLF